MSYDWGGRQYDYFCAGCGRMFRSAYCECPTCPRCGWQMSDAGPDRGARYRPPDYGVQAEMTQIQGAIDALDKILAGMRAGLEIRDEGKSS